MKKQVVVNREDSGQRLDKFLASRINNLSRTKIHDLIAKGLVLVDGKAKKAGFLIRENQKILITLTEAKKQLKPFDFKVKIIYEDRDIMVVDKPSGLVVHPPQADYHKTLVNALLYSKKMLSPSENPLRPGVVHRLDKETSGVMVLAKNTHSYTNLVDQFKSREVLKEYLAIVWGKIRKDRISIDLPLARDAKNRLKMKVSFLKAKPAYTKIDVLTRMDDSTYLRIKPKTGRMHQIRVHLKFLGFPIIGDRKYGIKDGYPELFLHARQLNFLHPRELQPLKFQSPLPDRFREFLNKHKPNNN